tara:strand:+ start:67 stop:216 length:150 start_codon:yes stop_codon:yes gene_type:complete
MIGRSTNIATSSNGSLAESNAVAEWQLATKKNINFAGFIWLAALVTGII